MVKKYFQGTSKIINLSIEIGALLGTVNATYLRKPAGAIRKTNKIQSIQASLSMEGNTLSIDQVTALVDDKSVDATAKEILQAQNAITLYNDISNLDAYFINDLIKAHGLLMQDLLPNAGEFRSGNIGVLKDGIVSHQAPAVWNVNSLVSDLFIYLNQRVDHPIIKSCVFHYQMAYIQPFSDGNGRMGRLWQTLLLMKANPVFEFIPIEQEIQNNQQAYYDVLADSDKVGHCTPFIEFMLLRIKGGLQKLVDTQRSPLSDTDRIHYFKAQSGLPEFTRKDYLQMFKDISVATASRDMKKGVEEGLWRKIGDGRTSRYVNSAMLEIKPKAFQN